MDFIANILAKLDDETAKTKLDNLTKKQTVDLEVRLTGDTDVSKILSKLDSSFASAGQDAGKSYSKGVQAGLKSYKFNGDTFYKQYFDKAKKDIDEAKTVQTKFSKLLSGLDTKGIDKNALKAARAYNKENSAIQKEQEKAVNAQKRILVQQRIAEMKSQAIQKNARRDELVQQGKDNISNWSQQYNKQYRENQKAYFKQVEEYNKRELEYIQKRKEYEAQGKKQVQDDADGRALVSAYKDASEYQKRESEYLKLRNQYISEGKKQEQEYYSNRQKNIKNQQEQLKSYTDTFNNGKYSADSKTMSANLEKYNGQNTDSLEKARNYLKEYQDTYKEIQNHFDTTSAINFKDDELVQKFDKLETAASKYKNVMREVSTESSKTLSANAGIVKSNEMLTYYNNNTKALKKYGAELRQLAEDAKKVTTQGEMDVINEKFKKLKSTISAEGLTGKSWVDDIKRATVQIAEFTGIYGMLQNVMQDVPRAMIQAVKDVDTAMTNLYKVTDETDQKYQSFLKNAGTASKELGRDMSSYITQTSEWAKLGYTLDQSKELSKISSIYANVGEVSDETAVSDLVTVMKAYNMQDSQAMNIVDMLNQLGNQYATSAADLGTGLSKMASTMSMSGVSLEKSLAVLTGGVEITQDADALGNAIKVSVLRMRGQKGALEELGEYADDVESVSKMQTQILNMTKGAVNIMDSADPTAFRDWYDVMEDVAKILPKLQETDQADLIETLFGKNRANQGQAILQAFQSGQIQKAYQTALNSEGSAMEEQLRWMDSIEAKQQQLSAAFQDFSTTVINSDFVKTSLDTGTGILGFLDNVIDKFGILQTLIGGFAIGKGITSFVKSFDKPACKAS